MKIRKNSAFIIFKIKMQLFLINARTTAKEALH